MSIFVRELSVRMNCYSIPVGFSKFPIDGLKEDLKRYLTVSIMVIVVDISHDFISQCRLQEE